LNIALDRRSTIGEMYSSSIDLIQVFSIEKFYNVVMIKLPNGSGYGLANNG